MAIVSKVPATIPGGHSTIFAGFRSGVNCMSFPLAKPTTICFPFGDQQQHFAFKLGSIKCNSTDPPFRVAVQSEPVSVHTARIAPMTGFQHS